MRLLRKILRLDLAALLPPETEEGGLVAAHDDAGVRAADECSPVSAILRHVGHRNALHIHCRF